MKLWQILYFSSDVDECIINNGGCEDTCVNTAGGFQCKCRDGYVVDTDNKTCVSKSCIILAVKVKCSGPNRRRPFQYSLLNREVIKAHKVKSLGFIHKSQFRMIQWEVRRLRRSKVSSHCNYVGRRTLVAKFNLNFSLYRWERMRNRK